jgi:hypothetical protein
MDAVVTKVGHQADAYEQQVRLLRTATRGVEQLADRLRLPASDPLRIDSVLTALRTLVYEHERLELELAVAALPDPDSGS